MGYEFYLTNNMAKVTSGADEQLLSNAIDVLHYDVLDLLLTVAFEAPTTPSFTVAVFSGMQTQSTDGWVNVGTFPPVTATGGSGTWQKLSLCGGYFRYVRWKMAALSGATAARFTIVGVARSYAKG